MTIARSLVRAATSDVLAPAPFVRDDRPHRSAALVGDRLTDRIGIVATPHKVRASSPWSSPRHKRDTTLTTTTREGFIVRRNSAGTVLSVTFPDGTTRYPQAQTSVRTTYGQSSDRKALDAMLPAIGDVD